MKDNVEFNIKFIDMVRERPCLYDYTRVDYSNKFAQDDAWDQIAKHFNESVSDCKEKWKNLRGSYTRHLKKFNRVAGPSGKRVKPYYLSDHLCFLASFTKTREPKRRRRNIPKEESQSDDDSGGSDTRSPAFSLQDKRETYVENANFSPAELTIEKPKHEFVTDINGHELQYYPPSTQDNRAPENQDPDFAFLYSMLPDLQEMSSGQKRKFKIGVMKLAAGILQENASDSS